MKRIIILLSAFAVLFMSSCASGKYRYKESSLKIISPEGVDYNFSSSSRIMEHHVLDSLLEVVEKDGFEWGIYSLKDNDDYLIFRPVEHIQKGFTILAEIIPVYVREGVECPTVFDADKVKSISFVKDYYDWAEKVEYIESPVIEGEAAADFMKKLIENPIDRPGYDSCLGYIYVLYEGTESIYFKYLFYNKGETIVFSDDMGNNFEISEELYNELVR